MDAALEIAQLDIVQRDFFHHAGLVAYFDHVPLADLVFDQDEQAVEKILDQALCAVANGNADHASGAEDGRDGYPQFAQYQHACHQADGHRRHVAEHSCQRFDAPHFFGRIGARIQRR